MSLSQSLSLLRRPVVTAAATAVIAATVLGGCAQEEPTTESPTTSTQSDDNATMTSTDAAPTTADAAPTTAEAAPTTAAPTTDDSSSTAAPTTLSASDGAFEVELPQGWVDAIDLVDTPGVQVAAKVPEQVDGFFTNILVTQEKYVKNLTSAVEATAKELAGKKGSYELLDPIEVDGNKAPGYIITREVSGKKLVQTQRWVSHDGTLYVATLSSLESEAKKTAPLLDAVLTSWTWKD